MAGLLASAVSANTVLTLSPGSGNLSGEPGQTVGWGFTIQDSQLWVTVVGTDFCSSFNTGDAFPCDSAHSVLHGAYVDFTPFNFVDSQPSGMGGPDMSQRNFSYKPACDTTGPCIGAGAFTIDATASIGTLLTGKIVVDYNLYNGNPNTTGIQQGGDNFITSIVSVHVIPEPVTLLVMGTALAGLGLLLQRTSTGVKPKRLSK